MYCNFELIDDSFLELFTFKEREIIEDIIYDYYTRCGSKYSVKLEKSQYFKSRHVKYRFVYTCCPKCKTCGLLLYPFKKSGLSELKYCVHCGESNIQFRFSTGLAKINTMITVSKMLENLKLKSVARDLNQQIIVLMVSVYEVYLRDCYAGIMNTIYVRDDESLFVKFVKDCKNDFLNPCKTNRRFKKDLKYDLKANIGIDVFTKLVELAEYRNVIVHNNGICDSKFLSLNIGNYSERDIIEIDLKEIQDYLQAIMHTTSVLDVFYKDIIKTYLINSIKSIVHSSTEPNFPIFVPPRKKND